MKQKWKIQLLFIVILALLLVIHAAAASQPATSDINEPIETANTSDEGTSTEEQEKEDFATGIESENVVEDYEKEAALESNQTSQSKQLQIPDVPPTQNKTKSSLWIGIVCAVILIAICSYFVYRGKKRSK